MENFAGVGFPIWYRWHFNKGRRIAWWKYSRCWSGRWKQSFYWLRFGNRRTRNENHGNEQDYEKRFCFQSSLNSRKTSQPIMIIMLYSSSVTVEYIANEPRNWLLTNNGILFTESIVTLYPALAATGWTVTIYGHILAFNIRFGEWISLLGKPLSLASSPLSELFPTMEKRCLLTNIAVAITFCLTFPLLNRLVVPLSRESHSQAEMHLIRW